MRRLLRSARLALALLTILPVRGVGAVGKAEMADSRLAFPIVGGAIGLALAALSLALGRLGAPTGVAAFLLVAAGVVLTGGLHLDGLADTSDGLFLWGDAGRRLAAMRDPHVGSFGVAAIVLVLLGKFAALDSLSGRERAFAVLGAAVVGRALILVAAGMSRYARPEGTGRIVVEATTHRDALAASALVLIVGMALAGPIGLAAGAISLVLVYHLARLASRKLGGITGDILGFLVEIGELVYLLGVTIGDSRA